MIKYDIFISYRREGGYEAAELIATRLRSKGYSVFIDVDELRAGKFNEQLLKVIDGCTDFILVLPKNALDRCNDENDWVAREIKHAMKLKKNIIPVMLRGFEWPSTTIPGLEELCNYQSVIANSSEYFNNAIDKMEKIYLKSGKKGFPKGLMTFILLIAVLGGAYYFMAGQNDTEVPTKTTSETMIEEEPKTENMETVQSSQETSTNTSTANQNQKILNESPKVQDTPPTDKDYETGMEAYRNNDGIEALKYFELSSSADSYYMIGLIFENGCGTIAKNPLKAEQYYIKAAKMGSQKAKAKL